MPKIDLITGYKCNFSQFKEKFGKSFDYLGKEQAEIQLKSEYERLCKAHPGLTPIGQKEEKADTKGGNEKTTLNSKGDKK